MGVNNFIEMLNDNNKYHKRDEFGLYESDYYFELEQDCDGLSFNYLITESVSQLSIEIWLDIDFKELITSLDNTIDSTILNINIKNANQKIKQEDILKVFKLKNIEKLSLINFGYVTDCILLDNINIRHLDKLAFYSTDDADDYKQPIITLTPTCRHKLLEFVGHLDTWGSLQNILNSPYVEHCNVSINNSDNLKHLYGYKVNDLHVRSDKSHFELLKSLSIEHLNKVNIYTIK